MALKLPNDKVVYNLPEQVGVNAENIAYLAEEYKNIDSLPGQWETWKTAADATMDDYALTMGGYATTMTGYGNTMGGYATTMQGYANTMGGYQTTMEGYAAQVDTWTNNIASAALGAIANGTVVGNLSVSGNFTANSIIENMSGYTAGTPSGSITLGYQNVVKNGNKITFVAVGKYTAQTVNPTITMAVFNIPSAIGNQFVQSTIAGISAVSVNQTAFVKTANDASLNVVKNVRFYKVSATEFSIQILGANTTFSNGDDYYFRSEITLTLGTPLV